MGVSIERIEKRAKSVGTDLVSSLYKRRSCWCIEMISEEFINFIFQGTSFKKNDIE